MDFGFWMEEEDFGFWSLVVGWQGEAPELGLVRPVRGGTLLPGSKSNNQNPKSFFYSEASATAAPTQAA
ncbi:MAG: hypothetical protein ACYC6M_10210 [Terriglobales bacterium]